MVEAITIQGGSQLEKKLKELGRKAGTKIVKKAVRAGARPIRDTARANALSMVGGAMGKLLKRFITSVGRKKTKGGTFGVRIGPSSKGDDVFVDVSKSGKRNYIPAALEYGHDSAAPRPFMRSAAESQKAAAVKEISRVVREEILKAAR